MNSHKREVSVSPGAEVKKPPGAPSFTITIDSISDYEFRVRLDKEQYAELLTDEPAPLGGDKAPNASRFLAAAVGNCLCASLVFCARKSHAPLRGVHSEVTLHYARNEKGRLRIGRIEVRMEPEFEASDPGEASRCLELFEDYCVVTQSVRNGIDVSVTVKR